MSDETPRDPCLAAFIRDYIAQPPYMRAEAFARLDACRKFRREREAAAAGEALGDTHRRET